MNGSEQPVMTDAVEPVVAEEVSAPAVRPIAPEERFEVVDILRGFALLGIFVVNMQAFNAPFFAFISNTYWTEPLDRATQGFIHFFAQGKFYTLFSLLFGFGFATQMIRAEARGAGGAGRYSRRLLVLLGIGMVHAFLIWMGDILMAYALFGFVLLLFRRRAPRTLLIWSAIFLGVCVLLMIGLVGFVELARLSPELGAKIKHADEQTLAEVPVKIQESLRVYGTGSFGEIMALRAQEVAFSYQSMLIFGLSILAMFLVGLYVGRRGLLANPSAHLPFFRKGLIWGLVIGLICNTGYVVASQAANLLILNWMTLTAMVASMLGGPAFCWTYLCGIVLLVQNESWRRRLAVLAPVGRMALTNYLAQSLICTAIFYSYGFGLFGKVGLAAGLALTFGIYFVQVLWSNWWLRRFRFGPMEWLWRTLTYGQRQPMRI